MPYKNEPKGVYCLTFPNGKKYVGIGLTNGGITTRFNAYKSLRCKDQPKLYNALKKYGPENVKYELLLETSDRDNACRSEMYIIDIWNLQDDRYGYNISFGGDCGNLGLKRSKEYCEIMSKKRIGKKTKPRTQEQKDKISNILKGRVLRPLGYRHSQETIKKIGESNRGKKRTPEQIAKNSKSHKGLPCKTKRFIRLQNRITNEVYEGFMHDLCIQFKINKKCISGRGYTREWRII